MNEKTIVFVGKPNTGKSTLINQLCKTSLQTGNWEGVTVEKAEAWIEYQNTRFHIIDLPGIHGFNHQSDEERITEQFLHNESIDCIVQVIDSTHVRSSLPLLLKLRHLQIPMVCLLNFEDEAKKSGIHIDEDHLQKRLSVPFLSVTALKPEKNASILALIHMQSYQQVQYRPLLNPDADRKFEALLIWLPIKQAIERFEQQYPQLAEREESSAIDSCMRFVTGNNHSLNQKTIQLDTFLFTHFFTRWLLLCALLFSFFLLLSISSLLSDVCSVVLTLVESFLLDVFPVWTHSYLSDVLISGIGALLGFLPLFGLFTLLSSALEECGIMSRLVLMADHLMRCFKLTGKSMITIWLAHGCNVPAILYSTSLEHETMRKKTALLAPLCCCSARLPVILYFFQMLTQQQLLAGVLFLYGIGLLCVLVLSVLIEKMTHEKIPESQIIELPVYRIPNFSLLWRKCLYQMAHYAKKVFKVVFASLSIIWFLMQFPKPGEASFLVIISKALSSLFLPLGFGADWMYTAAWIPGVFAKEAIAGTMMMLQASTGNVLSRDPALNLVYLVFSLTSIPCVMTLSIQKQKYGTALMLASILFSFCTSYLISWLLYQFTMFF